MKEYNPREFIQALEEGHGYDYAATHYWEMDRDELKDVILELIYAIGDETDKLESAAEELKERWEVE